MTRTLAPFGKRDRIRRSVDFEKNLARCRRREAASGSAPMAGSAVSSPSSSRLFASGTSPPPGPIMPITSPGRRVCAKVAAGVSLPACRTKSTSSKPRGHIDRADGVDPHDQRILARRPYQQAVGPKRRPDRLAAVRRQQQADMQPAAGEAAEVARSEAHALHVRRQRASRTSPLSRGRMRAGRRRLPSPRQRMSVRRAEMLGNMTRDDHLHVGEVRFVFGVNTDQDAADRRATAVSEP